MDEIKTRTADSADAENISHLVNAAFRPERFFIDADRTNPDKVRALLEKGKFLLAEDAGALVAASTLNCAASGDILACLRSTPRGSEAGMGSSLIDAAEQYCRAAGCRFMDLTIVNLRKELPGYYRRRGYVENGTLPFPTISILPKCPAIWSKCPNSGRLARRRPARNRSRINRSWLEFGDPARSHFEEANLLAEILLLWRYNTPARWQAGVSRGFAIAGRPRHSEAGVKFTLGLSLRRNNDMTNRILMTLLLSTGLALSAFAQQTTSSSSAQPATLNGPSRSYFTAHDGLS